MRVIVSTPGCRGTAARRPSDEERFVTYAYAALGGFLWALWAVFKSMEGREFGDYTIVMYRYAKNYYRKIVSEGLLKL